MPNKKTYQDIIKRYLEQELNEEELKEFQKRMDTDDEFAEEVANATVREYGRIELKNKLQDIHNSITSAKVKRLTFWKYAKIAAVILLLLIPLGYWTLTSYFTPKDLFATYFEPYRSVAVVRGENTGDLQKAMELYNNKRYEKTIPILEGILTGTANAYLQHFYLGMCYLAIDEPQYEQAITHFEKVLEIDNDYHEQTRWYLALAYFKANNKTRAEKIFKEIVLKKGAFKQKEADRILGKYYYY